MADSLYSTGGAGMAGLGNLAGGLGLQLEKLKNKMNAWVWAGLMAVLVVLVIVFAAMWAASRKEGMNTQQAAYYGNAARSHWGGGVRGDKDVASNYANQRMTNRREGACGTYRSGAMSSWGTTEGMMSGDAPGATMGMRQLDGMAPSPNLAESELQKLL